MLALLLVLSLLNPGDGTAVTNDRALTSAASFKSGDTFKMFNTLFFQNVDFSAAGIPRLFTSAAIDYVNGAPDLARARFWARSAAGIAMDPKGQILYDSKSILKIAHEPQNLVIDQESGIDTSTPQGRKDMLAAIAAIHDEWTKYPSHPEFRNLKLGIYGVPQVDPPEELDDPVKVDEWHARTDAQADLARQLDFIVPVLYANTVDQSVFGARMSLLIREAQRYGKPVYPYIWPEYFELLQDVPVNELIGATQWQGILDEARNEADGVIMWGGVHRYNPDDPWARITTGYLKLPEQPVPPPPTHLAIDPVGLHLSWTGVDASNRVRIERSLDDGVHWRPIGITEPGELSFSDPGITTVSAFTARYRIQAFNPFASSDYATSDPVKPARDGFSVNHAYWADDRQKEVSSFGPVATNIWPGRWVEFKAMSFRQDADHVNLYWKSDKAMMEVWIDSVPDADGKLVGGQKVGTITARLDYDDSPLAFICQSGVVHIPAATHDVFFLSTRDVFWLDWVKFGADDDPGAPPRALAASSTGAGVKLSWFDASDDETGFQIERSTDRGMTWAVIGQAPANHLPAAASGDTLRDTPDHSRDHSIATWIDATAGKALYTYRVSSLHGRGVATWVIPDVATGVVVHPVAIPFNADSYVRAIGVNEQIPGELYHTEERTSTHANEVPAKGCWVKYSGVDFGAGAGFITLNLAPTRPFTGGQKISFYVDRRDPDHKIGDFAPDWNGGWEHYDEQTAAIARTSGVHDLYMQFDEPGATASIKTLRIEMLSPVPDVSLESPLPGVVRVNWQETSGEASGYFVQCRPVLTKPDPEPRDAIRWLTTSVGASARSFEVKNLSPKTEYEFRVIAKTVAGSRPSVVMRRTTG